MKKFCLLLAVACWLSAASADSLNCRLVGSCGASLDPVAVAVKGNYAYVADDIGFGAILVADPQRPSIGAHYSMPVEEGRTVVSGGYAYVACADGLRIMSISEPGFPREYGFCRTPGWARDVSVCGTYAYVAAHDSGLCVISISDPGHPVVVGRYAPPVEACGEAHGVAVNGSYAYLADDYAGLRIISIADPAHPVEVGCCDTANEAYRVAVSGNYAYLLDHNSAGLLVVSISDPAHPTGVGSYELPRHDADDVVANGAFLYVADVEAGVYILSISDPLHPVLAAYYDECYCAFGLAVDESYVYVADWGGGLKILLVYGAGVEENGRPSAHDSRLRAPTIIRGVLSLPAASSPKLQASSCLLDAAGRKVLKLKPGPNDVSRLAPGVYFVRAEPSAVSRGPSAVRKVVLAK